MNEQNRQKLSRIAKRHASRVAQGGGVGDEAFLTEFARVRDEVLRPVMEEIGAQLRADGYDFRVNINGSDRAPLVELHVVIPGRDGFKDAIRFFALEDDRRGWQVIAEIELARSPTELARFDAGDPITRDVAEHMIVDATEQMFASALAAPGIEARGKGAAAAPEPGMPPVAAKTKTIGTGACASHEGAEGVRALALARLRDGRVLHGLDLVGADLHEIDFTDVLMPGLDLRSANLRGCVFAGANLVAARLQGADLTDAVLTGANLSRANLSQAILVGARFDDAVLVDAVGAPQREPPPEGARAPRPAPASGDVAPVTDVLATLNREQPPEAVAPPAAGTAQEQPTFLVPQRSPFAATSLALDQPMGPALPFAKGLESPATPAASSSPGSREPVDLTARAAGPQDLRRIASGTVAAPDAAAPPRLPAGVPDLTLDHYASLCAELKMGPGHVPATLARYNVSPDARKALDAYWMARFAADPPLRMKFATRYAQRVASLKGEASSERAPNPRPPSELAATTGLSSAPAGPIMPFGLPTSASNERTEARAESEQRSAAPPRASIGTGTVAASEGDGGVLLPLGIPDFTIEQYASLRVELEQGPDRVAEILARYGVPVQRREALEAYWEARFARDQVLYMNFSRAYAQYVAWLKTNRGGQRS